jgi:hypothetical protein
MRFLMSEPLYPPVFSTTLATSAADRLEATPRPGPSWRSIIQRRATWQGRGM